MHHFVSGEYIEPINEYLLCQFGGQAGRLAGGPMTPGWVEAKQLGTKAGDEKEKVEANAVNENLREDKEMENANHLGTTAMEENQLETTGTDEKQRWKAMEMMKKNNLKPSI